MAKLKHTKTDHQTCSECENARVRALRAARLYEPDMHVYAVAMAVYLAAFPEDGK